MWRKRDKGEGPPTRKLHRRSLWSEFSPSPYHQQKTGLFRNTMIAPATHGFATERPSGFPLSNYPTTQLVRTRPPGGRALRLPFGSASLRTNGPSPWLLSCPAPGRQRRRPLHPARQRGFASLLTPHFFRLSPGP